MAVTKDRITIAAGYWRLGFNVLAVGPDKRSIGRWKPWKFARQTEDDLQGLPWDDAKTAALAAISGPVSDGLVCLDFDKAPGLNVVQGALGRLSLPTGYPWVVRTPGKGGGWHVWLRSHDLAAELARRGLDAGKTAFEGPYPGADHVELRWNGCYTLLPPSVHPDGGRYEFWGATPQEPPAEVEGRRLARFVEWRGRRETEPLRVVHDDRDHSDEIARALQTCVEKIESAEMRNNTLNRCAYLMGGMAWAGADEGECRRVLVAAAMRAGLPEHECHPTFESGWENGKDDRVVFEPPPITTIFGKARKPDTEPVESEERQSVSWDSAQATERFKYDLGRRERGEIQGLPWPPHWGTLGRTLGPMEPGTFTVIAARPSVGKTIFASQLQAFLCDKGHRVLYVTRELTPERLVRRHVVAEGACMERLRTGRLEWVDRQALERYEARQAAWPVRYDHRSNTVPDIAWEARNFGAELVIVDYLQRMAYETEKEYAAITRLVNEFQDFAMGSGIPVLCLSQLSRPMKGQDHKPPSMSDTRGSGAVEERATSLVLLHRDWITEETEQYGRKQRIATCKLETGMFLVAKNADGEADKSICMRVDGAAMMIVEQMRAAA